MESRSAFEKDLEMPFNGWCVANGKFGLVRRDLSRGTLAPEVALPNKTQQLPCWWNLSNERFAFIKANLVVCQQYLTNFLMPEEMQRKVEIIFEREAVGAMNLVDV